MQEIAPVDYEMIREQRKIRNKEKRIQKRKEKAKTHQPIQVLNNVCIISPEYMNRYNTQCNPETNKKIRGEALTVSIKDLIVKKSDIEHMPKTHLKPVEKNIGNRLDADAPVRFTGKHREQDVKKRPSRIKRELALTDNCNESKIDYADNIITETLIGCAETFIREIVELQEKLFKRNPQKGAIKRRYVVGFHELRKNLCADRVKIVIIATDIKITHQDDPLHKIVQEIKCLANSKSIPYIFVLKRRQLGNLTLKHIPVSCMGILNIDGTQDSFRKLVAESLKLKETEHHEAKDMEVYQNLLQIFEEVLL